MTFGRLEMHVFLNIKIIDPCTREMQNIYTCLWTPLGIRTLRHSTLETRGYKKRRQSFISIATVMKRTTKAKTS